MSDAVVKPWWQSRTMIFNILVGVFAVLEVKGDLLASALGPQVYPYVGIAVAVVNVVLRAVTTQGVSR